jgi:hypothetical protein
MSTKILTGLFSIALLGGVLLLSACASDDMNSMDASMNKPMMKDSMDKSMEKPMTKDSMDKDDGMMKDSM